MKTEIGKGTETETGIVTEIGSEIVSGIETGIETIITETEMTAGRLKTAEEKYETAIETGSVIGTPVEATTVLIQFTKRKKRSVWLGWETGQSM